MIIEAFRELARRISANMLAASLLVLAVGIIFLALSLSAFTLELALVRRDLPNILNRIDSQIAGFRLLMVSSESFGKQYSAGVNKGLSEGIVEVPLGTVANVGYKLSDTAAATGKQTINIWQSLKDRFSFWQPKRSATSEAKPKR